MRGHATEFWIEDGTGRCGWCCHTCGIDVPTANIADAESAIFWHEKTAPAGVSAAPTSRDRPIGPAGAHQTSSGTTETENRS